MSPTLLEWAIAVLVVWIGWQIGSILAPRIMQRFRDRAQRGKAPPERKKKPPVIIDT